MPAKRPGISGAEVELIAGVGVGIVGAAGLFFIVGLLPPPGGLDTIFDGLVFCLMLWLTGLLVGFASPRGRRAQMPWLALLVGLLSLIILAPLSREVFGGEGFSGLLTLVVVLLASPFLALGSVGAWLIMKVIGR